MSPEIAIISQFIVSAITALIAAALAYGFRKLWKRDEKRAAEAILREQEHHALIDGVRSILRDRIIQAFNHYYMDKHALPIYAMENVKHMYVAYHALGGNGTITELYNKMMDLPQVEDPKVKSEGSDAC